MGRSTARALRPDPTPNTPRKLVVGMADAHAFFTCQLKLQTKDIKFDSQDAFVEETVEQLMSVFRIGRKSSFFSATVDAFWKKSQKWGALLIKSKKKAKPETSPNNSQPPKRQKPNRQMTSRDDEKAPVPRSNAASVHQPEHDKMWTTGEIVDGWDKKLDRKWHRATVGPYDPKHPGKVRLLWKYVRRTRWGHCITGVGPTRRAWDHRKNVNTGRCQCGSRWIDKNLWLNNLSRSRLPNYSFVKPGHVRLFLSACQRCQGTRRVPGRFWGTNPCDACAGTGRRKDPVLDKCPPGEQPESSSSSWASYDSWFCGS